MALLQYLDDEFFKLQDFLNVVSDGLPQINLDKAKDDASLFKQIIDQNKAYAKKIMNLIDKVDRLFKNNTSTVDKSFSSENSVLIQRRIGEYENNIKRLENENDEFLKQIKQLTKQIKSLHSKQVDSFTAENQKDPIELSNAPSPIQRSTFRANYSSNDPNYDIEYYMSSGDYKKTVEVLIQNDYKKPSFVPFEKFCGWLSAVHRLKDNQFNDILSKIKILINFTTENPDKELDESIDLNPNWTTYEKIQFLLEDRLPRVVMLAGENQFKSVQSHEDGLHKSTAKFQDTREVDLMDDDSNMDREQLRLKVRYLNSNLRDLEKQFDEAIREVEQLRTQLQQQQQQQHHQRTKSSTKNSASKYTSPEKLLRENETLLQNVDNEMKARYEAEAQLRNSELEIEQLKGKLLEFEEHLTYGDKRYKDLSQKMEENTHLINRLIEENTALRENQQERVDEGSSFGRSTRNQRSPDARFFHDSLNDGRGTTKNLKSNILVESSLQIQSNTLYNLKQMVSELKQQYAELISQYGINIALKTFRDSTEDLPQNNEALQLVKSNNQTIKEIQNDVEYVKSTGGAIITYLSESRKRIDTTTLYHRLSHAEEKLYESIANSIHNLSKVTTLIHELPTHGFSSGSYTEILNELQHLHSNLSKMIEEFPDMAPERGSAEKYDSGKDSLRGPAYFRERLARDQNDIHTKLKEALKQYERKSTNDTFNHLEKELERNQELQNRLEAKNLVIHKLQLVFNEGSERTAASLNQLLVLADSEDAQRLVNFVNVELQALKNKFKDVIALNKDSTLDAKGLAVAMGVEYSPRRDTHSRSTKNLSTLNDTQAERIVRELEHEKESHRKTYSALIEAQRAQRVAEDMTRDIRTMGTVITDRERELYQKDERYEELLAKFRMVERDCIELSEKNRIILEEVSLVQGENQALKSNIEKLREENYNLSSKLRDITDARNRDLETLQKQLETVRNENLEMRQYKDSTDSALKKTHDHLDHIKLNYFSEVTHLKETNVNLNARTQQLIAELEKKNHEIIKMNQMLDNLQAFSNRQLENIQHKDDRIVELTDKKREYELIINDLERNIQEVSLRNQKNVDNMTQNIYDTNKLKDDFQNLLDRNEDMTREIEELRRLNYELETQNHKLLNNKDLITTDKYALEERIHKINEINQITRTEVKNYKEMVDKKNKQIETLENEIAELKNAVKKSREVTQESELISHLKRELKARGDELSLLRQDYQRAVETIEKYRIEVETLRAANKLNEQHLRELDKVTNANRSISTDVEALRKTLRLKEDQFHNEKEHLEKELNSLKRKNLDLQAVLEARDTNRSKFNGGDGFRSDHSRTSSDTSYYNNLVESKDSEIKRLTQIVKNLTDNLRDAQESKYSLKK